jgi:hypothetical protein
VKGHKIYLLGLFVRAIVISMCYLISLTGINIIDVMNIVGSFFNLAVGIYFPVYSTDSRYCSTSGTSKPKESLLL